MLRLDEFKQLLHDTVPEIFIPTNPIPVDPWKSYELTCGECGYEYGMNQLTGTVGVTCPSCKDFDKDFVW